MHLKTKPAEAEEKHHNAIDGHDVPVPHYGVVLSWDEWQELEWLEFKAFKDIKQLFAV